MPTLREILGQKTLDPRRLTPSAAIARINSEHMQSDESDARRALAKEIQLREFVKDAWHVVEPATVYIHCYQIDAICEHLYAVILGQIRNLLINIAPRMSKSLLVSVFWPTHTWTFNPAMRFLTASYKQDLATRDSVSSRRLLVSPWYQDRWGDKFHLTSDQNQKMRYDNDKGGYRIATHVGGATGEGGDIIICDDPHDILERHSKAAREFAVSWWNTVMSTRLNDPKTGRKVVVGQRVHEDDLSADILNQGGYEHLCLPTEFDPKRRSSTCIGWADRRQSPGELLAPERFGDIENASAKKSLGAAGYSALHDQQPQPEGGTLFQRAWFKILDALPMSGIVSICRFWDCAGTEAYENPKAAATAGLKLIKYNDGTYVVADVQRGLWSTKTVDDMITQTAKTDRAWAEAIGHSMMIREEQEPGSAGKAVINSRLISLAGHDYRGRPATGDKATRARPAAVQCEALNVKLLKGAWNNEFLDELTNFAPGSTDRKDQVDSFSGAFNEVTLGGEWGAS